MPYLRVYKYEYNLIDKTDIMKPVLNFANDFREYLKQRTK